LVCVNQSTSLHHPLLSAGRFCINILHADQDELARTFGRKGMDRDSPDDSGAEVNILRFSDLPAR
jgi:flavin reductase (DIM6/NTAB) family NADH-FMN oxidoreductase RutF